MPRSSRPLRFTYPYQQFDKWRDGKYLKYLFTSQPHTANYSLAADPEVPSATAGRGAPTGAAGDVNVVNFFGGSNSLHCTQHIKGTQTILNGLYRVFTNAKAGFDIIQDVAVADDGVEYDFGGSYPGDTSGGRSQFAFTVGTDADFFAKLKFRIEDVSGTDDCAFGFRKLELGRGNLDDIDEMAALNVISGDVKVETILNNAATVTTDSLFNWADLGTHTLEVRVVGRRARYYINGTELGNSVTVDGDGTAITPQATVTAPSFSFDSGEVVIPFFFHLHDTDLTDNLFFKEFEVGHLISAGLAPTQE